MTRGYRWIARGGAVALVGAVLLFLFVLVIQPRPIPLLDKPAPRAPDAIVARGAYLARAGDCTACHTAPGGRSFAGGLRMNTPFGPIITTNITPDRETGIGGWSEAAFARALRRGVSADGHMLYSAMPYTNYTRITDADVHALKAFLDTVPPVRNEVHANQLPFPFSIRQVMLGWNLLFFREHRFVGDGRRSREWNRGAYLVDGLGHCSGCHTGKNLLGGDKAYLQGGMLDGAYAPELSGNRDVSLGRWTQAEIVEYLKTGATRHSAAASAMAQVVEDSTQYLTDSDLGAMAGYLKSLPGSRRTSGKPLPANDERMLRGRELYANNCSSCHRRSGEGVATMLPALAGNAGLQADDPSAAIRTVLSGGVVAATRTNPTGARMPGLVWKLSDAEIADVLTYARNAWGNSAKPVSPKEVRAARGK